MQITISESDYHDTLVEIVQSLVDNYVSSASASGFKPNVHMFTQVEVSGIHARVLRTEDSYYENWVLFTLHDDIHDTMRHQIVDKETGEIFTTVQEWKFIPTDDLYQIYRKMVQVTRTSFDDVPTDKWGNRV